MSILVRELIMKRAKEAEDKIGKALQQFCDQTGLLAKTVEYELINCDEIASEGGIDRDTRVGPVHIIIGI